MEKPESGYAIASFALIHGLLLLLIRDNKLTKSQVIEIIDSSLSSISFLPSDPDTLKIAEKFLERIKVKLPSP
jgi:hypothetical protein